MQLFCYTSADCIVIRNIYFYAVISLNIANQAFLIFKSGNLKYIWKIAFNVIYRCVCQNGKGNVVNGEENKSLAGT